MDEPKQQKQPQQTAESEPERSEEAIEDLEPTTEAAEDVKGGIEYEQINYQ